MRREVLVLQQVHLHCMLLSVMEDFIVYQNTAGIHVMSIWGTTFGHSLERPFHGAQQKQW